VFSKDEYSFHYSAIHTTQKIEALNNVTNYIRQKVDSSINTPLSKESNKLLLSVLSAAFQTKKPSKKDLRCLRRTSSFTLEELIERAEQGKLNQESEEDLMWHSEKEHPEKPSSLNLNTIENDVDESFSDKEEIFSVSSKLDVFSSLMRFWEKFEKENEKRKQINPTTYDQSSPPNDVVCSKTMFASENVKDFRSLTVSDNSNPIDKSGNLELPSQTEPVSSLNFRKSTLTRKSSWHVTKKEKEDEQERYRKLSDGFPKRKMSIDEIGHRIGVFFTSSIHRVTESSEKNESLQKKKSLLMKENQIAKNVTSTTIKKSGDLPPLRNNISRQETSQLKLHQNHDSNETGNRSDTTTTTTTTNNITNT